MSVKSTILVCAALVACTSGKVVLDTAPSQEVSNFWCSHYTSIVVYGQVAHLCLAEINELGEESADAWFEESVRIIQHDCTDYVNSAPEPDDIEYVIKFVCANGYDEGNAATTAAFEALTCADVTSDDFVITWPYEALCPCIADGLYTTTDGEFTCSPEKE